MGQSIRTDIELCVSRLPQSCWSASWDPEFLSHASGLSFHRVNVAEGRDSHDLNQAILARCGSYSPVSQDPGLALAGSPTRIG